jgi:gamma-glutamyl-gamma-aminobutyrate hydrolase PuuD
MRVVQAIGYDEPRDALSHDWTDWVEGHGWTPLPLLNNLMDPVRYLDSMKVGAIILTGGNDAAPRIGIPSDYCPARNLTERKALDWAIANGIPVLAVCRGMHIVNIHFGGTVIPDIGPLKAVHAARNHKLEILDSLGGILGAPNIETNSFHEQGIGKDQLADALQPFVTSSDGLIEGVVHPELPILAIQWHPERDNPAADFDDIAVSRLFSEGVFWHAE